MIENITDYIPSLISNLSLSFKDSKRNISIKASERFSQKFDLDNFLLQGLNVMSEWVDIECCRE